MKNIEKISDRIKQFIDYKKISINKFSNKVGSSNSYFNHVIKNGTSVGSDRVENILKAYPEINPSWLIAGEGEMLRELVSENSTAQFKEPSTEYLVAPTFLEAENILLRQQVEMYKETIVMLREKNEFLKDNICVLKEKKKLKEDN